MSTESFDKLNKPVSRFENFWHCLRFAFNVLFAKTGNSVIITSGTIRPEGKSEDGHAQIGLKAFGYTAGDPLTLTVLMANLSRQHQQNLLRAGSGALIAMAEKGGLDPEGLKTALEKHGFADEDKPVVH